MPWPPSLAGRLVLLRITILEGATFWTTWSVVCPASGNRNWQSWTHPPKTGHGHGYVDFLVWLLALDRGRVEERAWLSLLTAPEADQVSIATLHADGETWTREALQLRLRGLVEEDRLGQTSNILHVAVVGLIVSSEENPSVWPNDHQLQILDALLSLLGLDLTQPD